MNGFSQVVDGLRYVVNGFQYGGSLTLGSLAVVEKWIKASGEVLTKRPLEEIQASDTPPLYSVSFQVTCFNIIVADFRTWHAGF